MLALLLTMAHTAPPLVPPVLLLLNVVLARARVLPLKSMAPPRTSLLRLPLKALPLTFKVPATFSSAPPPPAAVLLLKVQPVNVSVPPPLYTAAPPSFTVVLALNTTFTAVRSPVPFCSNAPRLAARPAVSVSSCSVSATLPTASTRLLLSPCTVLLSGPLPWMTSASLTSSCPWASV